MNTRQCEEAVVLAMDTLREVCEDEETMARDRIAAARCLLEYVSISEESRRRDVLAEQALPLILTACKSLRGEIEETDNFSPIYDLEPQAQADFVLSMAHEIR